jgi:16S rRNA G966 N2-methylase RsmD
LTALQAAVARSGVLDPNGLLVIEVSARTEISLCGCSIVDDRVYGESRLVFLHFDEAPRRGAGPVAGR